MAEHTIKASLPGIFYRRPSPDAAPYVSEGDQIEIGTVIGMVGAMKTFHQITSDVAGRLERFLVENEQAIRPGQDIAVIDDGT